MKCVDCVRINLKNAQRMWKIGGKSAMWSEPREKERASTLLRISLRIQLFLNWISIRRNLFHNAFFTLLYFSFFRRCNEHFFAHNWLERKLHSLFSLSLFFFKKKLKHLLLTRQFLRHFKIFFNNFTHALPRSYHKRSHSRCLKNDKLI